MGQQEREFQLAQKPFFTWSLDTEDWRYLDVRVNVQLSYERRSTDGSIILMHDIHEPSVQAALQITAACGKGI